MATIDSVRQRCPYGYDKIYQLTSSGSETFTYDKTGNRTMSGYSHNANNELTAANTATYTYDANGNTITKTENNQTTTYGYDARNRLTQVILPDGTTASYTYDPFGRRIKKQTPTGTTYYLYANEGLIGEYSETGTVKKAYVWRPNGIWGTNPLLQVDNGNYYYYHNDHLGTPQRLTDESGSTVWSATYSAFGKASVTTSVITNNLRFPGQYADEETGLHYNWNRYFDTISGRYIQIDPIRFLGRDTNLYRYVQNNVNNYIDQTGTVINAIPGAIGAVIGGIAGGVVANVNGSSVLAGAGIGAATGALAGLTLGASLGGQAGSAAFLGGIAGFGGDVAAQAFSSSKNVDWNSAALAGTIGAVSGGVGGAVGFVDATVGALVGGAATMVGTGFQFNPKPCP